MAQDSGLTSAQGGHSGRRGLTVPPPIPQASLKVLKLLLLQHCSVLPLPACLSAKVLLSTQPASRLGDLKLQGQLALQAAQGVLRERLGVRAKRVHGTWGTEDSKHSDPVVSRLQCPGTHSKGWGTGRGPEPTGHHEKLARLSHPLLPAVLGWEITFLPDPKGPNMSTHGILQEEGHLGSERPLPLSI